MWGPRAALSCVSLLALGACTSVTSDLHTVAELYRDARYEAAAVWLDDLAGAVAAMSTPDRATYHYLRGMTCYRLSQREDALHELALAHAVAQAQDSALTPSQRSVLEHTLEDLMPEGHAARARAPRAVAAER